MLEDKNCGVCNLCCRGYLEGEAYGNIFKIHSPCPYLQNDNCVIYPLRPEACINFYCGWRQGLFSDNLFPPSCNFIISVESSQNKQYLKVVQTSKHINTIDLEEVSNFCSKNNTHFVIANK